MTPTQTRCLQIAIKTGNKPLAALIAMLASIEYDRVVNLSNAYSLVQANMSPIEWRQALATLAQQGKYRAMAGEYQGQYGTLPLFGALPLIAP